MRLNDPLVTDFVYEGKEYPINLAFDNVLDVFDVLNNNFLRDHEKANSCLKLLLGESLKGEEAINLWNYIYDAFIHIESKQPIEYDRKGNPMPIKKDKDKNYINIDKDAEYIFASFQQAYDINLFQQQGELHWHEFQSLLNGLPSNTIMQRIVQIRAWKPSKGESSEYKKVMRDLQKIYALNDEEVD